MLIRYLEMDMSLQARLDQIREDARQRIPSALLATVASAADRIRDAAIDSVVSVGARMPGFRLHDTEGALVSSASLLRRGSLVVSFFQGAW